MKGVQEAIEARGATVLDLPPYGPDFNPIGQVFSKIRSELRRREHRTVTELENAFGESLDWITSQDAIHYFQNSGYAVEGN